MVKPQFMLFTFFALSLYFPLSAISSNNAYDARLNEALNNRLVQEMAQGLELSQSGMDWETQSNSLSATEYMDQLSDLHNLIARGRVVQIQESLNQEIQGSGDPQRIQSLRDNLRNAIENEQSLGSFIEYVRDIAEEPAVFDNPNSQFDPNIACNSEEDALSQNWFQIEGYLTEQSLESFLDSAQYDESSAMNSLPEILQWRSLKDHVEPEKYISELKKFRERMYEGGVRESWNLFSALAESENNHQSPEVQSWVHNLTREDSNYQTYDSISNFFNEVDQQQGQGYVNYLTNYQRSQSQIEVARIQDYCQTIAIANDQTRTPSPVSIVGLEYESTPEPRTERGAAQR